MTNEHKNNHQALGTPTEESWPGISALPDFIQFKQQPGTPLRDIFTAAGDDLLDLMGSLLMLCPLKRCDATTALKYSAPFSCFHKLTLSYQVLLLLKQTGTLIGS